MASENQSTPFQENSSFSFQSDSKSKRIQSGDLYLKKWTVPENILYARYLKTHMGQMSNKKKKKSGKFVKMANFIGTKTQNQCRSHHQKMLLTFKTIQNIINYAAEIKKRGELIPLEEYQKNFETDFSESTQEKIQSKMEEQLSTERESQEEIKQEKRDQIKMKDCFPVALPIIEEESKMVEFEFLENDIFDVLNIDASQKYGHFFTC